MFASEVASWRYFGLFQGCTVGDFVCLLQGYTVGGSLVCIRGMHFVIFLFCFRVCSRKVFGLILEVQWRFLISFREVKIDVFWLT